MRHTGLLRRAAALGSASALFATIASVPAFAQSADNAGAVAAPAMDLSYSTMIAHADTIVQSVMSILAIASIVSWTILVAKSIELTIAGRAARKACQMAELGMPDTGADAPAILTTMRGAIRSELAASIGAGAHGTKDRLASRLRRIELRIGRQAQRGTGILATIGAVGPFVGLFGTVWGIMNSFIGIAKLHTTNLAVVAPGIAEALLATAMGLVAAIPAVIIYNIFSRWLGGYRATLADLSEVIVRHASRALDMDDEIQRTAPNPAYRLANAE